MRRASRLLIFLTVLLAAACGGRERLVGVPPEELYRLAQEAMERHRYEEAGELLDQIRDEYPFSKYAAEAELLSADMAFRRDEFEEAAAAYRTFEELHPTHPKAPYALYRRGLAYAEISLPADRDQTSTRRAAEAFQKLLYANPESEHAADARERLVELRSRLAAHELYVARYYVRKKNYGAALERLRALIEEYPDGPQRDEALQLALELKPMVEAGRAD